MSAREQIGFKTRKTFNSGTGLYDEVDYIEKDVDAVVDYQQNWVAWLNGDTISTRTWTVASGITKDSDTATTTTTTIWLSGGTAGMTYLVTNRIVTAAGRTNDRSFYVDVKEL